ncbi:hypothetical protein IMCC21906_00118 [Spongiibacter sp. IMCC21906]|nr:hypothetical protein IMCC21906_00118 [Spongiibacter sp. IMCC21906]
MPPSNWIPARYRVRDDGGVSASGMTGVEVSVRNDGGVGVSGITKLVLGVSGEWGG